MSLSQISPYIRIASFSTLRAPFRIADRALLDYEIILVSGGRCLISIDGTPYLCKKDDVVLIPPGIEHSFETQDNESFVQPHIHFDMVTTDQSPHRYVCYKHLADMSVQERGLIQENVFAGKNIPYVFTPVQLDEFRSLFFRIIRTFNQKSANFELLYKAGMIELIYRILSQFEIRLPNTQPEQHSPATAVKNYIDSNFLQPISLDALEKQFYCNKFTLMRSFKQLYRTNIISYYRSKRIEYAKRMLRSTSVPIRQIGEHLGFADAYSFSRFFKEHTGQSPRDYRCENK